MIAITTSNSTNVNPEPEMGTGFIEARNGFVKETL
jgi:hypothetical protein